MTKMLLKSVLLAIVMTFSISHAAAQGAPGIIHIPAIISPENHQANATSGATKTDWIEFSSNVSLALASQAGSQAADVLKIGITGEAGLLLLDKLADVLPERVAKHILDNPKQFAHILSNSAKNDAFKSLTTSGVAGAIGGVVLGTITDAYVEMIRQTPELNEFAKEALVFSVRQTGVLYAGATGGAFSAVIAQIAVTGKTMAEAFDSYVELKKQNKSNATLESQNAIGDQFLKLWADFKAEKDEAKKREIIAEIDELLRGEGSFLFAGSSDPGEARKRYIGNLAKNAGLSINSPQPAALTNEKLEIPRLDMRTANSTPPISSTLMQNQLTAITQGGSSHIGSAAYFMGRSPSQDFVRESRNTIARIPTIRETSQVTDGFIIQAPVDIVLRWGATPSDLDSHLTGPATANPNDATRFHTNFANQGSLNSAPNVLLYRDETTSFGPEQTRINVVQRGVYRFYVHDFTNQSSVNSTALSNSGAVVTLHSAGSLTLPEGNNLGREVARIPVPTNRVGTAWQAFELDSRTGILNSTSQFRNVSNSASVPFNQ